MNHNFKKTLTSTGVAVMLFCEKALATGTTPVTTLPDEATVRTTAVQGLDWFFGALSGFAVIFAGISFYQAFIARKNSEDEDGDGMSQSKMTGKIVQGVLCIIAAVIIFGVRNWVKTLFGL